ncbi:MAG: c-type cytochrome [Candidatus Binataceae bacterium]|nr:c-type cytochrome [Candidatus Binataceae bacterium]
MRGFGTKADLEMQLTWGVLIISVVVILIISALVIMGVLRRRVDVPLGLGGRIPVDRSKPGLSWIYIGVGISSAVLFGTLVWTMMTIAGVSRPPSVPSVDIRITAQQWWWQVQYLSDGPSRLITTANEIHIPVGQPVRFELISTDVIHSFWIPALSGKTDVIPGQTNVTWLEADKIGRYRGQCTEYCGAQHAHMALFAVAQSPAAFKSWWDHQLEPAPQTSSAGLKHGEQLVVYHCGACHSVRGTVAGGVVAPDLTHLMSRATIAAGTIPNNVAELSAWIADPQDIKPGNHMPNLYLSGPELSDVRKFLITLK